MFDPELFPPYTYLHCVMQWAHNCAIILMTQHKTGVTPLLMHWSYCSLYYNMNVWILAGNYISFTIAAGLIRLHMLGVKKSFV